jgi:NAD(P)-dependent dehydrogenase (short-subunit alcohol dehydrogenase family)
MRKRRIKDLNGREVFITGAASGIGRATALACAARGARVHLTDISADPLGEAAREIIARGGRTGLVQAADISDHDAVKALADTLTTEFGAMDVLMNIAGIAEWGAIQRTPHESWRRVIDVNLMGPIHVLEYLTPPMIDAGRGGYIINVSSAAGIIGLPWHAAYSASKFGLRGLSEVLRFDLARHRIGISLVCPGGVDTGLTETVKLAGVETTGPEFSKARKRFQRRAVTPEQAAESIIKGMGRGRYWVYTSRDIRLIHWVQRVFPPGYVGVMTIFNTVANRLIPEATRGAK